MRLPSTGAVTGWAACRLWGGNFFDGLACDGKTPVPVPLALGPGSTIQRDARVVMSYDRLPAAEVVTRFGIRTVRATRAAFDAARFAPDVREAVVVIEMAVAAGFTSIERIARYAATHPGTTGIHHLRDALQLAREHARSPQEVRFRMVWELDALLPRPEINCPIHDREGNLIGVADLIDLEAGLLGEYDGAEYRDGRRHTRDVRKEDALRRLNLEVVHVTGSDLADRRLVVERLHAARARSPFEPVSARRWVARPLAARAEATLKEQEAMAALLQHVVAQPLVSP